MTVTTSSGSTIIELEPLDSGGVTGEYGDVVMVFRCRKIGETCYWVVGIKINGQSAGSPNYLV